MKRTPELYAKGFYTFSAPWVAKVGVVYECLAIRSFEDIYKLGIDVYNRYYLVVGLVEGQQYGDKAFNFELESQLKPNIITLKGSDGSVLYIPDTFIEEIPSKSLVPYSEIVLAVSLGLIPDTENLDSIQEDVAALVAARMHISPTVNLCKVSTVSNPTAEEHELLQSVRAGTSSDIRPNTQMLLEDALEKIKERDLKIATLLKIMREKGIINDIT